MESVILEQSMNSIIYLLAVSLGYSGAKIIGRNINEHGEFDLMKAGRETNAIFAVCQIEHFNECVVVLKTEITTYVNQLAEIIHS
jgi:hypothetical protein